MLGACSAESVESSLPLPTASAAKLVEAASASAGASEGAGARIAPDWWTVEPVYPGSGDSSFVAYEY